MFARLNAPLQQLTSVVDGAYASRIENLRRELQEFITAHGSEQSSAEKYQLVQQMRDHLTKVVDGLPTRAEVLAPERPSLTGLRPTDLSEIPVGLEGALDLLLARLQARRLHKHRFR